MPLTNLPEEILIIIIRHLDLYSQQSLYDTCKYLRNIICMHGVIKHCHMSLNVMATANTLKLNFFKDISHNLYELNMCGVTDLYKTAFIPALKKLKNLKVLDVSYTNLLLVDIVEIHKLCPTLKDITINFVLSKSSAVKVTTNTLLQCQSALQHFENIHFIGSIDNLLYSKLGLYLTAKANLHQLKYTISQNCYQYHTLHPDFMKCVQVPQFDQFTVYLLNWKSKKTKPDISNVSLDDNFNVLSILELNNYEYVIICIEQFESKVYTSPMFMKFFQDKFDVMVEQSDIHFFGNVTVMVWNKETTKFDEMFYHKLTKYCKQCFPYYLEKVLSKTSAAIKYDWFYSTPIAFVSEKYMDAMRGMNKKRVAAPNFVLNYDFAFKEKHKLELSIEFKHPANNAIALSDGCEYLRKLTYFSLVGFGRYSYDFFNILFRCCNNLVTLNVQGLPVSPCASAISCCLPLSKSLKNIRLVDKGIDFESLFSSFSQCPTLENIHLVDQRKFQSNHLANPSTLLEKCNNLYSVYIEAQMTDLTEKKTLQMFNKAKAKYNRHYVNVTLQQLDELGQYVYDPFVDIFRLSPIRPA